LGRRGERLANVFVLGRVYEARLGSTWGHCVQRRRGDIFVNEGIVRYVGVVGHGWRKRKKRVEAAWPMTRPFQHSDCHTLVSRLPLIAQSFVYIVFCGFTCIDSVKPRVEILYLACPCYTTTRASTLVLLLLLKLLLLLLLLLSLLLLLLLHSLRNMRALEQHHKLKQPDQPSTPKQWSTDLFLGEPSNIVIPSIHNIWGCLE